jgi:hypothetical protein
VHRVTRQHGESLSKYRVASTEQSDSVLGTHDSVLVSEG